MRIKWASVFVDDQERAIRFYTEKLGFVLKEDVPVGEARWLTVVSADDTDGVELVLEPMGHPAAAPFARALFDSGIPFTQFEVADVRAEFERLRGLGVEFRGEPQTIDNMTIAVLDDTVGNLIQIIQLDAPAS